MTSMTATTRDPTDPVHSDAAAVLADHRPAVPGADWVRSRASNVEAFLTGRGLDPAWLTEVMTTAIGPGQLLLTSSPVHGLANPTSDFDFIRIADVPVQGPRISTKIFEQGHHLEAVSFNHDEVRHALARLADLAALAPEESVSAARRWDTMTEPRRKQTERIVNGVTLDGRMPHLDALPDLAVIWARLSLQNAVEHVTYLALAEAAGETRGRVGYAVNAVLHLADALLCLHGEVYTTRKWFLQRWARAQLARHGSDALRAAAAEVDRLRATVTGGLHNPAPLLPAHAHALRQVAAAVTGQPGLRVAIRVKDDVTLAGFLPGAYVLVSPATSVVVPSADLPDGSQSDLTDLTDLAPDAARATLTAIRAAMSQVEVRYRSEGART